MAQGKITWKCFDQGCVVAVEEGLRDRVLRARARRMSGMQRVSGRWVRAVLGTRGHGLSLLLRRDGKLRQGKFGSAARDDDERRKACLSMSERWCGLHTCASVVYM